MQGRIWGLFRAGFIVANLTAAAGNRFTGTERVEAHYALFKFQVSASRNPAFDHNDVAKYFL